MLNALASNGHSEVEDVDNSRHVVIAVAGEAAPALRVRVKGSISERAPDFTAPRSASNMWDYIQTKDLQDASTLNGDSGLTFAGTADVRMLEINTNGLKFYCLEVDTWTVGNVTAISRKFTEK